MLSITSKTVEKGNYSHLIIGRDDSGDESRHQVLLVHLDHAGDLAQHAVGVANGSLVEQKRKSIVT